MPAAKNYSGKRYGKLFVEAFVGLRGGRRSYLCACDCGNKSIVPAHRLVSGQTTSCGCRKIEAGLENCKKYGIKPSHGKTGTTTHKTWMSMIERCQINYKASQHYSQRGITVCDRWMKFENFYQDMGDRPTGKTLDRIDVNKPYSPDNCRWATNKQQQRNKTNSRYLIINGKKRHLMDVADELGIKKSAAQYFFSVYRKLINNYGVISIGE